MNNNHSARFKKPWLSALIAGACCYQAMAQTTPKQYVLDWVPIEALSAIEREALPLGSCGAYIAPVRSDADASLNPDTAPIRASANQSTLVDKTNKQDQQNAQKQVILIGDVHITQGYRQLKAQRAELDQSENSLTLEGELEVREPGFLVLGERAKLVQGKTSTDNTQMAQESSLEVENAHYVLHQQGIRGSAERIDKNAASRVTLQNASYTQCEPGNTAWLLQGSQIILDTETRQGHAKHVRLLVKGIPVFYLPYLRFPLGSARLSGFLAPTFSYSKDDFRIAIPYYFNLAPNYDLLFTTHWIEANGALFEGQFRHLNRYFESELNLGYLHDDRGAINEDDQSLIDDGSLTEADVAPFKGEDRWVVNLQQQSGQGRAWSTLIDYTDTSDRDYFEDFGNQTAASETDDFLNQRIITSYKHKAWNFGLSAIRYQLLSDTITTPYRQVPALTADGRYSFAETNTSAWALSLNNEWIDFDHDDADGSNPILTGQRLRSDYGLEWQFEPEWGFLRPKVQLKHLQYWLEDNNFVNDADQNPSITVPQAVLDGGLYFERDGSLLGKGYLQTFEPRLFYFYSDFEDHSVLFDLTTDNQDVDFDTSELTFDYNQLFRDTRFAGNDRIDDANQLAIGLTTRFYGNQSGREWLSASLGQIHYFDDRRVTLNNQIKQDNSSAIALQLQAQPLANWRLSSNLLYDESLNQIDRGNLSLRYQNKRKQLFDLSYRYVRGATEASTIEQIDAAVITPLFVPQWHLLLYSAYDTVRNRELDTVGAIQYNACCYRLRLGYRSELDTDFVDTLGERAERHEDTVFFEVHLTGLGGTSKQLDNLFTDAIDGYDEWQATYKQ